MCLAFALPRGFKCGAITGFALTGLGLYGVMLKKWRTEPGLWMLALFLALVLGACYGFFAYGRYANLLVPQPANPPAAQPGWERILWSVDVGFAFVLFWRQVSLAFSLAILNWQWTRGSKRIRGVQGDRAT